MLSKVESGKNSSGESSDGQLLTDIEEISKALYLDKTPPKALISLSNHRSKSVGKTRFSESKSDSFNEDFLHKDKRSSIWNWKPLKALTHIRNRQFRCSFFLHVHAIEGLPSNFNGISLCVNWKRKDEMLRTHPARVTHGIAEFEETLMRRCSVYGSRNGLAKYEPKLFLLYASVIGAPGLDIGKHWIDLTRLLPLSLEELEKEKSLGKWTTSFKLTGKAEGAMLNVSFGFSVMGDNSFEYSSYMNVPNLKKESTQSKMDHFADLGQSSGNGPSSSNHGSHFPSRSVDIKILSEVFPNRGSELSQSITFLYQKLDKVKLGSSQEFDFFYEHVEPIELKPGYLPDYSCENTENECNDTEFTIIEQGLELPVNEQLKMAGDAQTFDASVIETIDVTEIFKGCGTALDEETECYSQDDVFGDFKDEVVVDNNRYEGNDVSTKESATDELKSFIHNSSILESEEFNFSQDISEFTELENNMKTTSCYKAGRMVKSLSLDDVTESVTNDFLKSVGVEQSPSDFSDAEPESPRELLLRQFEEDVLASGSFIFYFDGKEEQVEFGVTGPTARWGDHSDNFDLALVIQAAEKDHKKVSQPLRIKRNAKILENLETEALMHEWGLNERAFQTSPCTSSRGFGSPIYLPPEEPMEFPSFGEGLGPIVRTKDGGFLRFMNSSLFRNSKNGGNLIMQVSAPVVLPVAMGSSIMEILQHWASVGFEKMSMQAKKLMPLEDITGKMMRQVAWEVASRLDVPERLPFLQQESEIGQDTVGMRRKIEKFPFHQDSDDLSSTSICDEVDLDYGSLEDIVLSAMDKIEALSIEGLRIQCGMSDEKAPSSIRPQSIVEPTAFIGMSVKTGESFSLEGATGFQLFDVKDKGDRVDELMSLSITLKEWLSLDAGVFGDEDEICEKTSKILAAHRAKYTDLISRRLTRDSNWQKLSCRNCGYMGNNFTVALMVQLRDPLRDYETVGAPMLGLIQVERVFLLPTSKVYITFPEKASSGEEGDLYEQVVGEGISIEEKEEKRIEECGIPQFKITEVHVAGLNSESGKKQLWGTRTQQQSGARWLLASHMSKTNKHPYLKSNGVVKSSLQVMRKVQHGDTLWSISSYVHGTRAKWKEMAALNLHVRNPDVIF